MATVVTVGGPGVASAATVPCADVTMTATPSVVAPWAKETVATSLFNCSGAVEVVKVKLDVTGPRGHTASFAFPIWLRAGQTRSASVSFPAPPILGTYSASVTISFGSTVLDSASASFIVQ